MHVSDSWLLTVIELRLHISIVILSLIEPSLANPPFIDIAHNMRILKLPVNTRVGSLIYRLKGTDADNDVIQFGVRGLIGNKLLDIRSASFFEADVYLKMPLDEKDGSYNVTLFAQDPTGDFTEVESTIIVTQSPAVNDSPFVWSDSIIRIAENTRTNETIANISVRQKDSNKLPVTFELKGSDHFTIKYTLGPEGTSNARIKLAKEVDYEKQNLYVLTILALNAWTNETYDTRNIATLDIVVAVDDVQDSPPVFTNLPNVLQINENIRVGTIIFTFHAEDSDYANQRNVTYDLEQNSPLRLYFGIDEGKGSLVLRRPVQDIKQEIGSKEPMVLGIRTIEIKSNEDDQMPVMSTEAKVAIVIVSTDNKRPVFKSQQLFAIIDENSQLMTPVRWQGSSSPQVTDDDPGLNGTIVLSVSDPSDTFMIQPTRGINQINFAIIVKDNSKLDYESSSEKKFDIKITANDQSPHIQLSSTIFCTIRLIDVNDNIPQFSQRVYEVLLPEDAPIGTTVAKIEATDADSGDFGRIRFTSINGPLSDDLKIDSETGVIVLIDNRSLDREIISEYRVTVEVRDDLGRGNANVTEVHIKVLDANDNKPVFLQPRYDSVLNPDRYSFTQPLVVKAIDRDEPGTANSNVSYEITGGNYLNKFSINEFSGEITLNSALGNDRNFKLANEYANQYQSIKFLPAFVLNIRAHDHGIPYQWSEVPVYIHNPDFLNRTVTFVIGDNEQNVIQRKEAIESGMSSLSGAKTHIYSIRPQDNNKELTEVVAWLAYPSQSTVDLSRSSEILSQITGKDYNLEEAKQLSSAQIGGNDMKVLVMMLGILILITLSFLMCFLCWFCRDKRRREKEKHLKEINNMNAPVVDSVGRDRDRLSRDRRHKKSKKRSTQSIQAWNESESQIWRPSSAPNNEADHYSGHLRANSSHSFQDQYLSHNPSLYHRVPKLSRHQRVRVGPVYHDSYQTNDIPIDSRLSEYSYRTQSHPMRSFRGVDNIGYVRTTNEPIVIDDLTEDHGLQRSRPLAYNDKYLRTHPKRTEILYIQSPITGTHEEYLRSVSQNERPFAEEHRIDGRQQVFDPNAHVIDNSRENDRMKAMTRAKQRHVIFNEHNVSDIVIPEEGVVPGMMPKDGAHHSQQMVLKPSFSGDQEMPLEGHQSVDYDHQIVSDSRDHVPNDNKSKRNALSVDQRINESSNYSPYEDETIQITSVKGVPVSIELKDNHKAEKSSVNESIERESQKNGRTRKSLIKENSVENSDHSYDSDSGIGRPAINPKIELEMKNSGLIEKKSIFTIAYNDVKTRHLQSAESNTE